jgi:hypothetical protein
MWKNSINPRGNSKTSGEEIFSNLNRLLHLNLNLIKSIEMGPDYCITKQTKTRSIPLLGFSEACTHPCFK